MFSFKNQQVINHNGNRLAIDQICPRPQVFLTSPNSNTIRSGVLYFCCVHGIIRSRGQEIRLDLWLTMDFTSCPALLTTLPRQSDVLYFCCVRFVVQFVFVPPPPNYSHTMEASPWSHRLNSIVSYPTLLWIHYHMIQIIDIQRLSPFRCVIRL